MTTVELLSSWLNCPADWMRTVGEEDIVADREKNQATRKEKKKIGVELKDERTMLTINDRHTERQSSSGGAAANPCSCN